MDWCEISIEVDREFVEPVTEMFRRYGGRDVVLEYPEPSKSSKQVLVKTFLPVDELLPDTSAQLDLGVRLLGLVRPVGELKDRIISEEDWSKAWRKQFHVLHIGRRLVICPTWRNYSAKPDEVVVQLDPGMAFGTGLHPTTQMCLELLERHIERGMKVLDLGTGSGILAISAAKLGASSVLGLDIDPVATKVAAENLVLNDVQERVTIENGTLKPSDKGVSGEYDLVAVNITAKAISDLAPLISRRLKEDRVVVCSGILDTQADQVTGAFAKVGLETLDIACVEDWRGVVLRKGRG